MDEKRKAFLVEAGLSEKVAGALATVYSWQECYALLAYLYELKRFNA